MPELVFECDKEIAIDSPDHICPHGTVRDNSRNSDFNQRLYSLFGGQKLCILDLGCSGGGFVKDCLDDGHIAFGLEGSDISKRSQRAEWATIPNNLFTCDITEPYGFYLEQEDGTKERALFHVITAWEVLEHLEPQKVPQAIDYIADNLCMNGLFCCSIPFGEAARPGNEIWHQSIMPKEWWESQLARRLTPVPSLERYFGPHRIRYAETGCINGNYTRLA